MIWTSVLFIWNKEMHYYIHIQFFESYLTPTLQEPSQPQEKSQKRVSISAQHKLDAKIINSYLVKE